MRKVCNTSSCNTPPGSASVAGAARGRRRGGLARCLASVALVAAAGCTGGADVSPEVNAPGGAPLTPAPGAPRSDLPFLGESPGAVPPAPGGQEVQEPEPNATETNFITLICWQDSDCPGGTCQAYASDAGARAAALPQDAGTPDSGPDVGALGPPRGRCVIP